MTGSDAPLAGRRVLVTRPLADAGALVAALRTAGAEAVEAPVLAVELDPVAVADAADARDAAGAAVSPSWVVVTSVNGVRALAAAGLSPGLAPIAAVGPVTAAAATDAGFTVGLVPAVALGAALVESFPTAPAGAWVLLAQADRAGDEVARGLAAKGWEVCAVTAYRTVVLVHDDAVARQVASADAVTFLSGSAVEAFVTAYGAAAVPSVVVCIGPSTAAVCNRLGLGGIVTAPAATVAALVGVLVEAFADRPSGDGPGGAGAG